MWCVCYQAGCFVQHIYYWCSLPSVCITSTKTQKQILRNMFACFHSHYCLHQKGLFIHAITMKLQKVYAISYLMMILIPCDTLIWSLWRTRLQHSRSIDSAPGYHCLVFPNISPASKFYCVTVILPGKMNEIMWDISRVQCLTTAYCPNLNPVENKICSFTIFFFLGLPTFTFPSYLIISYVSDWLSHN